MRLSAAIQGNLKAMMAAEVKAAERAVSGGVRQATDGLKNELRGQVTGAGLGERLAKSWRGDLYPKGGMSINAAGFVYTKAPQIIGAFAYGTTIRSKRGRFLAIPTQYVTRRENKRSRLLILPRLEFRFAMSRRKVRGVWDCWSR
jgi:hypothetical protein